MITGKAIKKPISKAPSGITCIKLYDLVVLNTATLTAIIVLNVSTTIITLIKLSSNLYFPINKVAKQIIVIIMLIVMLIVIVVQLTDLWKTKK